MRYPSFVTTVSLLAAASAVPAWAQSNNQSSSSAADTKRPATLGQSQQLPLTADLRQTSNQALQATLYDLIALKHDAHQEHWNIVGIEFYQLHEFYAELYTSLDAPIDRTAERIRALGQPSDGRPAAVAQNALPKTPPVAERSAKQTLTLLENDWATVSNALNQRIGKTSDDLVTQDLLIGITHMIDKQLWQLRAHLARMDNNSTKNPAAKSNKSSKSNDNNSGQ